MICIMITQRPSRIVRLGCKGGHYLFQSISGLVLQIGDMPPAGRPHGASPQRGRTFLVMALPIVGPDRRLMDARPAFGRASINDSHKVTDDMIGYGPAAKIG